VVDIEGLQLAKSARTDRAAAAKLIERLLPTVRHAVRMLVRSHGESEDLVQTCMVEILGSLHGFRGEGSLQGWANGVTYRVVMRHMKRNRRREERYELTEVVEAPEPATSEQTVQRRGVRAALEAHLHRLSDEQRMTLVLRVIMGHSVAEVAQLTGVRVNTARGRIRSALRVLRDAIAGDSVLLGELAEVADEAG
jgi:RNA polymerase sigma-70 factor (ECF subfamily)